MEAISGVQMGGYLGGQNDPAWRLSCGSKWPNMEAILGVEMTQHGGYLVGQWPNMEGILGVKMTQHGGYLVGQWPNMQGILGLRRTQHGSYLGGQNDPTWRLSWGSEWPNMEAILGVRRTQHGGYLGLRRNQHGSYHGSYLGGQNDPTWRLSWGSEGPNMEAILWVKMTQHGGYLGGQNDPTWKLSWRSEGPNMEAILGLLGPQLGLSPKFLKTCNGCLNRKQCCSFLLFTRPTSKDLRPQLGPKPKNFEGLQCLLPQEAMLQLPLCLQRRPLQDPFCIHKLHPHSLVR